MTVPARAPWSQFLAWFAFLAVPTLAFKAVYLVAITGGDLRALTPQGAAGMGALLPVVVFHLAPADLLDVAVIVGLLFLVGHRLLKVPIRFLAAGSVAAGLLCGGANAVSLRQLGSLLTPFTIAAGWRWTVAHPGLIAGEVTWRRALVGLAAIALTLLVLAVMRARSSAARVGSARDRAAGYTLGLVTAFALFFGSPALLSGGTAPAATRGFWSASVLSLLRLDEVDPRRLHVKTVAELRDEMRRVMFPEGRPASPDPAVDLPADVRRPRHIVLIELETAPAKYYRLADDPAFTTFHAMAQRGIVGDAHYSSAPATNLAMYGILSGTYARPGSDLVRYGAFMSDGLATVLERHGYDTTYIDSYDLHWNGPDEERTIADLGFRTILDDRSLTGPSPSDRRSTRIEQERRSFERALKALRTAASSGRHALVCIATDLGHYDWLRDPSRPDATAADRLRDTALVLDRLTGTLLTGIDSLGLASDTIVVVTGDHGLRFTMEFESVGEPVRYGDATFRVPLLIYAPGIFDRQVRTTWPTSHVDLTPTLLDLVGVARDDLFHHGADVLDRRLADRVVFLPSGTYPGLRPVDGFRWRDEVYADHTTTGVVTVRQADSETTEPVTSAQNGRLSAADVRQWLTRAHELFQDTAAWYLQRTGQGGQILR